MSDSSSDGSRPAVVLVHGAFAESASWNGVIGPLLADGYPVIAESNPLRGLEQVRAPRLGGGLRMAATQRPITEQGLVEPSGADPAWTTIPSWFIFGEEDRNIPAASHRFMAERASARTTEQIAGASHACGVSRREAVTEMIRRAGVAVAAEA